MDGIAHSFSPINGEYTGPVFAQESPLQEGKLLRPYNASFEAPPKTAVRECAVFAHGAVFSDGESRDALAEDKTGIWSIQPDWRAVVFYSTVDGALVRIEALGEVPAPALMTEKVRPSLQHIWGGDDWVISAGLMAVAVKARRNQLLQDAQTKMAPLIDAADIGIATPEESALLLKWKKYRVDLSRLEQQTGFPIDVQWPDMPDAVTESQT